MKKFNKICFLVAVAGMVFGCSSDDEKFSGSPVGHQNIVTLKGTVTTPVSATGETVLTGQEIDFTVELPAGRVFNDTVAVEVTSTAQNGGRTRKSVDVMPGATTATGKIAAVGGAIFNTTFDLAISAINLQTVDPGIHYLMTSDKVVIKTGSSTIPDTQSDRLIVRLLWQAPNVSTKNLKLTVDRPLLADISPNTLNSYGRAHVILNALSGFTQNGNQSTDLGEYIFNISAIALSAQPVDMPYRMLVVFPNGDVKVFDGVYEGLTTTSPLKPVLKVLKALDANNKPVYTVTDL